MCGEDIQEKMKCNWKKYLPTILSLCSDTPCSTDHLKALTILDKKLRTPSMGAKVAGAFKCYPVSIV